MGSVWKIWTLQLFEESGIQNCDQRQNFRNKFHVNYGGSHEYQKQEESFKLEGQRTE